MFRSRFAAGNLTGKMSPGILIPVVLVTAGLLLPLIYLVIRTFGSGMEIWGLLFRVRTLRIFGRSLFLIIGVTGTCICISLPLAWLITRTDLPFRRFWSVVLSLPLVMPSYVAGFVIIAAFGPKGMLQKLLETLFGITRIPDIYGYPGALLTIVLISYPLMMLNIRASLRGLDLKLEEASRSLGFSSWSTYFRVILPQLRPSIASGALLVALYTLRDFGAVSLLRYETFTWAIYLQYQTSMNRSAAAGLSLVLVFVALCILQIETRTRGKAKYYRLGPGTGQRVVSFELGGWKWPSLFFCAFVVIISLAIPMSVLTYWVVQGVARGEPILLVLKPTLNSLVVSGLSAITAIIVGLPVAFFIVRNNGKLTDFVERTVYIGYALPGIVVALALVFFTTRYLPFFYQSIVLLVFGYVVLFLPQALGPVRLSLLQINPHLEEAARSLKRKPLGVMSSITVPLLFPGIIAGASMVFFTTMKELPAALLLSPVGFKTLSASIWSATSEAFFARAAVPALILIAVSTIPLILFTLREKE